jgi:hypothetical protein
MNIHKEKLLLNIQTIFTQFTFILGRGQGYSIIHNFEIWLTGFPSSDSRGLITRDKAAGRQSRLLASV